MSELTEVEIFDRLRTSLRTAVDLCGKLATVPAQGPNYRALIVELELIEGAARQAGYSRDDMRWQLFGYNMARFHQRIGDVIRSRGARKIFLAMAKMIEGALAESEKLRTAKTGRRGLILPIPKTPPLRQGRPVQVKLPSGLLVPAGALN
jgi:hypothetical protein